MSRLPEQPFGALVGHLDDRRGRSRSRDPPATFVGPKRRIGTIGPVDLELPRSRKGVLRRLRASDVGHEHGGTVGRIAEGVASGEAEEPRVGGTHGHQQRKTSDEG